MRPSCERARQMLSERLEESETLPITRGPLARHLRACPACQRFQVELTELDCWLRRGSLRLASEPKTRRLPARVTWAVRARRLPVAVAALALPLAAVHAVFPLHLSHHRTLTPCTRDIVDRTAAHTPEITLFPLRHHT